MRAVAVLGAAAVLAGSYTFTTADSTSTPPVVQFEVKPVGETYEQWAVRAQRTLDSVNSQLDVIADTEVHWNRAAETQRAAARAAPIEALRDRRALLVQRQASLRSQLELFSNLQEAQRRLAHAEQQLAIIEAALGTAPPPGQRSPEQAFAVASLTAQLGVQRLAIEGLRAQVAHLREAVEIAAHTPLPADDKHTALVSGLVLSSLENGGKPAQPDGPVREKRPEAIVERSGSIVSRVRYDIPNGAPPDPRGPRDEPRGRGTAGKALGGVRQVAPPVTRRLERPPEQVRDLSRGLPSGVSSGGGIGGFIAGAVTEGMHAAQEQERREQQRGGGSASGDADSAEARRAAEAVRQALGVSEGFVDLDGRGRGADAGSPHDVGGGPSRHSPGTLDTSDIKDWDDPGSIAGRGHRDPPSGSGLDSDSDSHRSDHDSHRSDRDSHRSDRDSHRSDHDSHRSDHDSSSGHSGSGHSGSGHSGSGHSGSGHSNGGGSTGGDSAGGRDD
jgi:hypothetical protein